MSLIDTQPRTSSLSVASSFGTCATYCTSFFRLPALDPQAEASWTCTWQVQNSQEKYHLSGISSANCIIKFASTVINCHPFCLNRVAIKRPFAEEFRRLIVDVLLYILFRITCIFEIHMQQFNGTFAACCAWSNVSNASRLLEISPTPSWSICSHSDCRSKLEVSLALIHLAVLYLGTSVAQG